MDCWSVPFSKNTLCKVYTYTALSWFHVLGFGPTAARESYKVFPRNSGPCFQARVDFLKNRVSSSFTQMHISLLTVFPALPRTSPKHKKCLCGLRNSQADFESMYFQKCVSKLAIWNLHLLLVKHSCFYLSPFYEKEGGWHWLFHTENGEKSCFRRSLLQCSVWSWEDSEQKWVVLCISVLVNVVSELFRNSWLLPPCSQTATWLSRNSWHWGAFLYLVSNWH